MINFTYTPGRKFNEILDREIPVLTVGMIEEHLSCEISIGTNDPEGLTARLRRIRQDPRACLTVLGGRVVPLFTKITSRS